MVRTPRSQTKNTSFTELHVKNNNQTRTNDAEETWAGIADQFGGTPQDQNIDMVGSKSNLDHIDRRIQNILTSRIGKPKFLLVSGPSGCGKTTVIRKSIHKHKDKVISKFYLSCAWIKQKAFGDPWQSLRVLHKEASEQAPSVIYIKDIHVAKAEIMIDFLETFVEYPSNVLLIAETINPDLLDPVLLNSKYFCNKLELSLPKPNERLEYINSYLANIEEHGLTESDIYQVVEWTHCHSYSDINQVCDKASYIASDTNSNINLATFEAAHKGWKPVNIASVTTACKPLRWDQIGGVEEAKSILRDTLIAPLMRRQEFEDLGVSKSNGALLYGPPGNSKTLLARALATESGLNLIYVKGSEYISKYVGDSEAEIRKLYRRANELAPCIIFIDEIDILAPARTEKHDISTRLVGTLLLEMDSAIESGDVFTIGATNKPFSIDKALLRFGRLASRIYIPLPSESDRVAIFRIHLSPMKTRFDVPLDEVLEKLASLTPGYSGADIAQTCAMAGTEALCKEPRSQHVEWRHFEAALAKIKPSTNSIDLRSFERFSGGQTPSTSHNQSDADDVEDDNTTILLSRLFARLMSSEKG